MQKRSSSASLRTCVLGMACALLIGSAPAGADEALRAQAPGPDLPAEAAGSADASAPPAPAAPAAVRIGFLAYSPPWYDGAFVDESIRYLSWRLPQHAFSVRYLSAAALEKAIRERTVDLVVAPEAFLASSAPQPLHELASLISDAAPDSGRSLAAAVIVRRDREDLQTLADLRGKRIAAVTAEPSPGMLEVQGEAARLGADPDAFFGSVLEVPRLRMKEVLSSVLSGRADAGILRSCFLEDLWRAGNRTFEADIRVLDAREGDGLSCRHSTALYPGWTFAAAETLPQDAARAVTAVLLTKPANAWGQYWTVSTNASSYSELMRTLRIGPYAYLREWTLERAWREYRAAILFAGLALIGLLAHSALLELLVRRRTRELERVHREQEAAERQAREMTERIEELQRAGAVGQISSIVAHEMKQPLAVIQNLSRGTLRLIEDRSDAEGSEEIFRAVDAISTEAGRAAAIIDRVRSYSQGRSRRQPASFAAAVAEAARQFRATRRGRLAQIVIGRLDPGNVLIDPLDLELIIINLLANAAEAAKDAENPKVTAEVRRLPPGVLPGESLELRVTDNGPRISDAAFAELGVRVSRSAKTGGLGLGLSIVKSIAESSLGRLTFERPGGNGIAAVVTLPLFAGGAEGSAGRAGSEKEGE